MLTKTNELDQVTRQRDLYKAQCDSLVQRVRDLEACLTEEFRQETDIVNHGEWRFHTRQGWAIARMERRIVNQRWELRTIKDLSRGLTHDEWAARADTMPKDGAPLD